MSSNSDVDHYSIPARRLQIPLWKLNELFYQLQVLDAFLLRKALYCFRNHLLFDFVLSFRYRDTTRLFSSMTMQFLSNSCGGNIIVVRNQNDMFPATSRQSQHSCCINNEVVTNLDSCLAFGGTFVRFAELIDRVIPDTPAYQFQA